MCGEPSDRVQTYSKSATIPSDHFDWENHRFWGRPFVDLTLWSIFGGKDPIQEVLNPVESEQLNSER